MDVASGQDILVIIYNMSLLKWTINENMAKKHEIFLLQDGGGHDSMMRAVCQNKG